MVRNLPAVLETWVQSLVRKVPWRREWLPTPVFLPGEFCEYSLERLMLKLKLQYFGHLIGRAESLEKILMPGKIEGRRRLDQQWMSCLNGITGSMDMS